MSKYFALLTQLGADRLANAAALGTKIEITHMAVGDGGGSLPTPDTNQQKLINEKRRAAINVLSVDPKNTNQIIAEQVIPEHEGGWWIREIGLFDKDGVLMAVANCAETYKPQLQEGSGRTQTIRMVLIVSHTNAVTLKIDPSVVLATREYADSAITQAIREHEQSRRHPDATLQDKGFVVLSNAIDSPSETQAATPKAVKNANDNANNRLDKRQNGADIPNTTEFVKNLGLTATKRLAENAVPSSRKINNKTLTGDITLNAGDVEAYPSPTFFDGLPGDNYIGPFLGGEKSGWMKGISIGSSGGDIGQIWIDSSSTLHTRFINKGNGVELARYVKQSQISQDVGSAADRVMSQFAVTTALNTRLEKTVPIARKINDKPLTGDITLNAGDVKAYPSPTYFTGFPRDNYVGPFLCGESGGWIKGLSIGSSGGDIGQIWIDPSATLHTRFLNRASDTAQQQRIVSVPIGATIEWQSKAPIPDGFMLNDGRAFNRHQYQELLKIFPDGQLPDDRGLFKRALDSSDRGSRNYDPGRQLGTIQGDAIRNITGGVGSPSTEGGNYGNGAFAAQVAYGGRQAGGGGNAVTFTFDASRVVPTANENRPVNKSVIYITRVF